MEIKIEEMSKYSIMMVDGSIHYNVILRETLKDSREFLNDVGKFLIIGDVKIINTNNIVNIVDEGANPDSVYMNKGSMKDNYLSAQLN